MEKECWAPWKRSAGAHEVMGLGAIGVATTNWPPVPAYRVGNMLHSISGWFKVALKRLVNYCVQLLWVTIWSYMLLCFFFLLRM
jgi:hypothetical protein